MSPESHPPSAKCEPEIVDDAQWSVAKSVGFRFLFSIFCLYVFRRIFLTHVEIENDVGSIPGAARIVDLYTNYWAPLVAWTGHHLLMLRQPLAFEAGGNSDGIYTHVEMIFITLIAVLATLIWSILARNPAPYTRLMFWLRVVLRYALACIMWGYGMAKVCGVQFTFPNLIALRIPYGDFHRFDVLWRFMGASTLYTNFTGVVEIAAAALLLFRRTTTLGVLLTVGALVNVLVLDISYSVPEKLDVLGLLAVSFVLLWPDVHRLASVLLLNQPAPASALGGWQGSPRMTVARNAIKFLLVASAIIDARVIFAKMGAYHQSRSPLYGIYKVERFTRNGQIVPPLTTDTNRWGEVLFIYPDQSWIKTMGDSWNYQSTTIDTNTRSLIFVSADGKQTNHFAYSQKDTNGLTLTGLSGSKSVVVTMSRVDETKLPLVRSRFRWFNGFP